MIGRDEVMAVVVSFNGGDALVRAVGALRPQVGEVLVVDNASGPASQPALDSLATKQGITVLRLAENAGLGRALNLGVAHARRRGFGWLLTMDQDSVVEPGFVAAYARAHESAPTCRSFTPEIVGESAARGAGGEDREVAYAITSGHLVQVGAFAEAGEYDEGFFIDCIDFDFSLRLRRAGIVTRRVHGARMRHQLGEAVRVPARLRPFYARHAPARRYYMYRNYGYLARRHLRRFPGFVLKLGVLQGILTLLIAAYDVRPAESYRAVWAGVRDFLGGRTGPYVARAR